MIQKLHFKREFSDQESTDTLAGIVLWNRGQPKKSHISILVVDGNRLLNSFLTAYLRRYGHTASSLTDGGKVLEWLEENPCDAVIVSDNLSVVNEYELTKRIRAVADELIKTVPVVIFADKESEEGREKTKQCGANSFIHKGLGSSKICSAVMRVIKMARIWHTPDSPQPPSHLHGIWRWLFIYKSFNHVTASNVCALSFTKFRCSLLIL